MLKFDRDKVDGIEVNAGGKPIQLAKEGPTGRLARPVQARADYGTVEGLIGRLQSLQMKSMVAAEASPADLKKYGFDKPDATVNVNLGSARATLLIGGKSDDNTVYARDASKPAVMTVESALADDLKKGADEYRRKDIFEFRAFNATHLEITRNGQTVVFDKVKGQGDKTPDQWKRVSPKPADIEQEKMDDVLTKLSNIRAASFVESTAKTGLDAPAMTVVVKFDDGKKEERVTFGKAGADTFASRPDEPGAAKIDTADFDQAVKALDEIIEVGGRACSAPRIRACSPLSFSFSRSPPATRHPDPSPHPASRRSSSSNTTSTPSSPRPRSSTASGACSSNRSRARAKKKRSTASTRARC